MDLFDPTILCPLRAVELSLDWIYDVDDCKDVDAVETLSDDRELLPDDRGASSDDRKALSELPSSIDSDAIVRTVSLVTIELNPIVLSIPIVIHQESIIRSS